MGVVYFFTIRRPLLRLKSKIEILFTERKTKFTQHSHTDSGHCRRAASVASDRKQLPPAVGERDNDDLLRTAISISFHCLPTADRLQSLFLQHHFFLRIRFFCSVYGFQPSLPAAAMYKRAGYVYRQ